MGWVRTALVGRDRAISLRGSNRKDDAVSAAGLEALLVFNGRRPACVPARRWCVPMDSIADGRTVHGRQIEASADSRFWETCMRKYRGQRIYLTGKSTR